MKNAFSKLTPHFQYTLITALLFIGSASCNAQSIENDAVTAPTVSVSSDVTAPVTASQFDAQYEDTGVKVYISKVFPHYQLKPGQGIENPFALSTLYKDLVISGYPMGYDKIFNSMPSDSVHLSHTSIIASTRSGIAKFAQHQNSNKIVGGLFTAAAFALGGGGSGAGAISNLNAASNIIGSGVLQSSNFKDNVVENSKSTGIEASDTDIIYISTLSIDTGEGKNKSPDSMIYMVVPKSLQGELFNGKVLGRLCGETIGGVITRAVIKSANIAI